MSRSHTPQPETHGVTHPGQAPQVAVRDGNRLLCPCCGQTLMVLKEKRFKPPKMHHMQGDPRRTWPSLERLIAEQEAHYQKDSTDEAPSPEPPQRDGAQDGPMYRADSLVVPIDPKVTAHEFPPVDPPKMATPEKPPAERSSMRGAAHKPPRDWNTQYEEHQRRRAKRPLEDATTHEMARLYAWAYYRLQRLAVQIEKEIATKQTEIDRLQAKLDGGKKETTHQASTDKPMNTNGHTEEKSTKVQRQDRPLPNNRTHAQADLGVAPGTFEFTGNERGTGTRRHAHADEGMAPRSTDEASTNHANLANERGPP